MTTFVAICCERRRIDFLCLSRGDSFQVIPNDFDFTIIIIPCYTLLLRRPYRSTGAWLLAYWTFHWTRQRWTVESHVVPSILTWIRPSWRTPGTSIWAVSQFVFPFLLFLFIYLFHFFCPGLCNAHPSASLEDNPIVAQVLWFVARQPMIFSFLWIYWVWLLILHFYYSNDRSTIVAIVVRVVLALFAAGYPEFTSFIGWETRCFFFSRLLFASTSRPTCLM